jgi:hypothetical protein
MGGFFMKFAKIAVFAIAFSFLGSFCWGMDQQYSSFVKIQPKKIRIVLENKTNFTIYLKIKTKDFKEEQPGMEIFGGSIGGGETREIYPPANKIITLRAWDDYDNYKNGINSIYGKASPEKIMVNCKIILGKNDAKMDDDTAPIQSVSGSSVGQSGKAVSTSQPKQPIYQPTTSSTTPSYVPSIFSQSATTTPPKAFKEELTALFGRKDKPTFDELVTVLKKYLNNTDYEKYMNDFRNVDIYSRHCMVGTAVLCPLLMQIVMLDDDEMLNIVKYLVNKGFDVNGYECEGGTVMYFCKRLQKIPQITEHLKGLGASDEDMTYGKFLRHNN